MQYIKLAAITGLLASSAVAAPSTVVSSAVTAPTHSAGPIIDSHLSLPGALPTQKPFSLDLKSLFGELKSDFKTHRPESKTHHKEHHSSGHKEHKECSKTHHFTHHVTHTKTHTETHHSIHTHTETHQSTHTVVRSSLPAGPTTLQTVSKSIQASSVPVAGPSTY
ncbi:hypothetical protein AMS68_005775 [Peltaster fructicola]|uniref:Uncharacterized protein n=1 Tax=Peltaster fructicola TaxID=286661 RepID=A0A6H0Y089_9PEZI|nr:hypothetical protein AMS68_005775 [Peltaster fructicola]